LGWAGDSIEKDCRLALLGHSPFGELEDQIAADPQRIDLASGEPFPEPFLEIVLGQRTERGENRT
jgi:hypothetical protein